MKKFFLIVFLFLSCTVSWDLPKRYSYIVFHNNFSLSLEKININEFEFSNEIKTGEVGPIYEIEVSNDINVIKITYFGLLVREYNSYFHFKENKTYDIFLSGYEYGGNVHDMGIEIKERN